MSLDSSDGDDRSAKLNTCDVDEMDAAFSALGLSSDEEVEDLHETPSPFASSTLAPAPAPYMSASLYVGDLHQDVTESDLNDVFSDAGSISSIRLCRDPTTRRSLGYGYVNYQQPEDAERAIMLLNFSDIKGKACRVCWSQRDPTTRRNGVGNTFIKNLPKSVDNKRLYDEFSRFGNIASSKVCTDGEGKPVGYGFVHFESEENANKAIEAAKNGKLIIDDSNVTVEFYKSKKERGVISNTFTNIYVKNLPPSWDKAKLDEFFSQFGTIASSVLAYDQATNESRGFGFVDFATHEGAVAAIEGAMNTVVGEGEAAKKLYACDACDARRALKKAERERQKRELLEQARLARQQRWAGCNLYLKFLPENMTEERLTALFSKFGTITSVELMTNTDGASTGVAFVSFSTPEEASRAIAEMSVTPVEGKPIYVGLHQSKEIRQQMQHQMQHANRFGAPVQRGPKMFHPHFPTLAQGMPMHHGGMRRNMHHGMRPMRRDPPADAPYPRRPRGPRPAAPMTQAPNLKDLFKFFKYPPETQRQLLGEALYPLVVKALPENSDKAPKITGMLLEMEPSEVLATIDSEDELKAKVGEALEVLAEATQ